MGLQASNTWLDPDFDLFPVQNTFGGQALYECGLNGGYMEFQIPVLEFQSLSVASHIVHILLILVKRFIKKLHPESTAMGVTDLHQVGVGLGVGWGGGPNDWCCTAVSEDPDSRDPQIDVN